ncbi:hypothetical protein L1785_16950 [Antribacter sp. KLBMP9083]|uniref:Uncharacterized protein n=1 Tax=Antribacter soli TaxID=2910976 RepID=A0AA41UD24_9MICO|nr:hypothetical protein [Antribacter soli]MCF4122669.1 hypothetical protein [Antribacter soli]
MRDFLSILARAGRVFGAHWPALLTLACCGAAVRGGAHWAAVVLSNQNSFAAQALLVLQPIAFLVALVAMLRVCGRSLEHVAAASQVTAPTSATEGRPRRLLDVSISLIVPFLFVYAGLGLLDGDRETFLNEAAYAEFNQFGTNVDIDYDSRLGFYSVPVIVGIVAGAWVVRWLLGLADRRWGFVLFALVGSLVEVLWTGQLAAYAGALQYDVTGWTEERRGASWAVAAYESAIEAAGPLADGVAAVGGLLGAMIGSADVVIVIPLGLLTISAVVLGHQTMGEPEAATWTGAMSRVPGPARSALRSLTADLRSRWSAFREGLRMLSGAGLVPMLLCCLAVLVVLRVDLALSWVVRAVVGPRPTSTWLAFSPWEGSAGLALAFALLAPLLAAMTDRLVASGVLPAEAVEDAPVADSPVEDAPVGYAPVGYGYAPAGHAPVQQAPVGYGYAPAGHAPVQQAPVGYGYAPAGYAPVGYAPVDDALDDQTHVAYRPFSAGDPDGRTTSR